MSLENRNKVVSGPIIGTVLSLAVPVTLGMLMEFALTVTDFYWVGKLGPSAQDAVTSSMVVIWSLFAIIAMISIGLNAIVSRNVGARDLTQAAHYVRQGIWFAIMLGMVLFAAGYYATPMLMDFMEASPTTSGKAIPYLRFIFLSIPIFAVIEAIYASFRASGDTRTPMKIGVLVLAFNMILDPLLIFGIGPFPRMGVAGAGLGTLISITIGLILLVQKIRTGKLGYPVGNLIRDLPKSKSIRNIGRIGLPIATQQFIFVGVYWFLIRIVHSFGDLAGAAMGIGNRMESISYLTTYGISLAAATMVGQNLGAGKPERAAKCAWTSVGLGVAITLFFSMLFLTIPGLIVSVFTDNSEVSTIAVDYLIILGLSQITMAIEIIIEGAFSGAGDTMPPMIIMIPGSLARIPLAYWLAIDLGWGINGVWWTLTITTTIKASILAYWFWRGKWKLRKV